ncbi:porin family protein [Telluria mixta]|uniref:Porin family protein n=1 Tax=Telluria mixta TaxID=34071 RepID=A0ABT2C5N9_9BURK|nr:porin family protein [Telluria mixta]MCS0632705.1 porin family protein [Telluria mixta]WEM97781.1 porin family protein [Telluria mixta]
MKKLIVALIATSAAIGAAQAQTTQTQPRAYVGVGIATADHVNSSVGGLTNVDSDGYKASGKIFGGYEFDQNWGVEAGYTDFRNSDFNYTANGVNGSGRTKGNSYYVAGKYNYPVNDQFAVYGKLGLQHSERKLESAALNLKDTDTGAYGAVGVQYNLNQQVALTAEYERYGKSKAIGAKADAWTVGARYSF